MLYRVFSLVNSKDYLFTTRI